ncbi:MAG: hypothetical protein K2G63_04435, partial [Oscillospiraceae bacterium]|nr:hypothetical protein [Oscillospiraceae bacterium]
KLTALISAFTLAVCAVPMVSGAEVLKGDLNQDGVVDMADVEIMSELFWANDDDLTDEQIEILTNYADIDGDGIYAPYEDFVELTRLIVGNPENTELGDVNHDGFVNAIDATMICCYYAAYSCDKSDFYTEAEHENFHTYGDLNGDGRVNSIDASHILCMVSSAEVLKGDLNQDGIVDMADVEIMREWLFVTDDNLTDEQIEFIKTYGDLDGDGICASYEDFVELTRLVVGNPENTELGDVNHDGFVNAIDATMISCYYAAYSCNESDYYTEAEHENFHTYGDWNGDGRVNAVDASHILIAYAERSTL